MTEQMFRSSSIGIRCGLVRELLHGSLPGIQMIE